MKRILVGLALSFLAVAAHAADVRVTCTAPTKNTDGSNITGAISYSIYGGLQGQTKTKLASGATACDFTRTNVALGVQEYYVTATVGGIESAPSQTASVTITPPTPNAPTGTVVVIITVQVGTP